MRTPPPYFHRVQSNATKDWEILESRPDIAAPWWQLFSQLQSPRHVLSELLQNADDAGATTVNARIDHDTFIFEHDGEDFTEEQFQSLCRFGYSNKRVLHTIGFRGVGFKSAFSLGDVVAVVTPTLAVAFKKTRFTEPIWLADVPDTHLTQIRIDIQDESRLRELKENLDEWSKSPVSLLFFNNIKKLTISGITLERQVVGEGPVPSSEIVRLTGKESFLVTVIRSSEEAFPPEAVEEIRKERITGDNEFQLPPCRVELVIGLSDPQRFYVILPTEVQINLPFSCNAPFLQDPARTKIKDVSISPTNRWLLERIGRLASEAMMAWLEKTGLRPEIRAQAYDLLPPRVSPSSEITSERIIREVFSATVGERDVLLTVQHSLFPAGSCIAPPYDFYKIWKSEDLHRIFGSETHSILAAEITVRHRKQLASWNWIKTPTPQDIINTLSRAPEIPKPDSFDSLWILWKFVYTDLSSSLWGEFWQKIKILPVEGSNQLSSANTCVRIGTGKREISEEDWAFLSHHLRSVDQSWLKFLSELPRDKTGEEKIPAGEIARQLLEKMKLDQATSIDILIERAYKDLAKNKDIPRKDLIRITHLAAALDAKVPSDFLYITRDNHLRNLSEGIAYDTDGELERILTPAIASAHLLHDDYSSTLSSCTGKQWSDWIDSEKSGLKTILGFVSVSKHLYGRLALWDFVQQHGGTIPDNFHLSTQKYFIVDYDWDPALWAHWKDLEKTDPRLWVKILRLVAVDPSRSWKKYLRPEIKQRGRKNDHPIDCGEVKAEWIIKFQALPCLPDTHDQPRLPSELLIRSRETDPVLGVEAFVHGDLDTPETKDLLVSLGTRTTPTGPEAMLQRIRLFVGNPKPPTYELEKLYGGIDRLLPRCSTSEVMMLRHTFENERLIFTDQGTWGTAKEVFQSADEKEITGVPLVFPQVRQLSMWGRLGVPERPTLELLIKTLHNLKSNEPIDPTAIKRVRKILSGAPVRIWNEFGHWVSLDNVWVPVTEFRYCLTMQELVKWRNLFPQFKRITADLTMVTTETRREAPFSSLKDLNSVLEYRVASKQCEVSGSKQKPWIRALANGLQRIVLPDEQKQAHVRKEAGRLAEISWQCFDTIQIAPFINGTPAGEPHVPNVFWEERTLYVRDVPTAKIVSDIGDELARPFDFPQLSEVIKVCVDRDKDWIEDYLGSVFRLEEIIPEEAQEPPIGGVPAPASESVGPQLPEGVGSLPQEATSSGFTEIALPDDVSSEVGTEEASPEETLVEPVEPVHERKPRDGPSLMDRFTRMQGYRYDGTRKQYIHQDGSILVPKKGGFNLEKYLNGEVVFRFWVTEQCLATRGIDIASDLWELILKYPETSALVLEDPEGEPTILTGAQLMEMKDRGEITLHVAKYRIRQQEE